MTPSWYSYGTPGMTLQPTAEGVRTAFNGQPGAHGTYSRWSTNETWTPPYTFTGRMKVRSKLVPFTIGGNPVTYTPSIVWHVASMPNEPGGVNDNNLVVGIGGGAPNVGASAELYRPDTGRSAYGVRTGYVSRLREPSPDPVDGKWHTFKAVMVDYDRYQLWWDDALIADIVEKQPASMRGPLSIGLRLDGFDVELADLDVDDGRTPMPQPFDRSRFDWYPTVTVDGVTHSPAAILTSSGTHRPLLPMPLDTFTVHYGGAGSWLDPGDTAQELAAIERNWAIPQKKPNEYNSASDSEAVTWEWAGRFQAAHSAGENNTAWGHLCLLGMEMPTEAQADRLIAGIRKARTQLVGAGWLTADHRVVAHRDMSDAQTSCPGPLHDNPKWWARIIAPLMTLPPPPPPPTEVDMLAIDHKPGGPDWTALCYTGTQLAHVSSGHADAVLRRAGVQRQTVNDAELDALIRSSQTTTPCPPAWISTPRGAAWTSSRG